MKRITQIFWLASSLLSLNAEVTLDDLFTDHMVIQQGVTIPVWGTASPGEKVNVMCAGRDASTVADASGKWLVTLRPVLFTGESFELIAKGSNCIEVHDVLPGDVWIAAGEGAMAMPLSDSSIGESAASLPDSGTRFFIRNESGRGRWVVVSTETSLSLPAIPFFFARDLRAVRRIPIGVIDCAAKTSTPIESWIAASGLAGLATPASTKEMTSDTCSKMFTTLVQPVVPFAITGVIWNQGASETGRESSRHRLFLAHLIRDWRRIWEQGPFPFLMILPPGDGSSDESSEEASPEGRSKTFCALAWIREGIVAAERLPNTAVASCTELGNQDGSHFDPLVAGRRLALTARHLVYGEGISSTGPLFREARVEQGRIRIYFDRAKGGLTIGSVPGSAGGETFSVAPALRGFSLRGTGGRWFPAQARIDGDSVLLSSDAVPRPVAARYNWKNVTDGNLYDRTGLPAPPFRTDSDQPVP